MAVGVGDDVVFVGEGLTDGLAEGFPVSVALADGSGAAVKVRLAVASYEWSVGRGAFADPMKHCMAPVPQVKVPSPFVMSWRTRNWIGPHAPVAALGTTSTTCGEAFRVCRDRAAEVRQVGVAARGGQRLEAH